MQIVSKPKPPVDRPPKGLAVPSGRMSRLTRFGSMATAIGGNMLLEGARNLAAGKRPKISDLLLTPGNAIKLTNQLANLRGAAMKLGQMLSMDTGDLLPPELAEILGRLRADAQYMPRRQLVQMLVQDYGDNWEDRFADFTMHPMAAASIGQVHRAKTCKGEELAVKIQYPGVRDSIDSDVDNVATLIKISGLIPRDVPIQPMLEEAKIQLHQEADYEREAKYLKRFGKLLKDDPDYQVPLLYTGLTTRNILAMSYVESVPIEALARASQKDRDRIITLLFKLVLKELFEFHLMQTDPNFANYRYNEHTNQLVLLDFGATREIPKKVASNYRKLMQAGVSGDREKSRKAAIRVGLFDDGAKSRHQETIMDMFETAMEPLRHDGPVDFADNALSQQLREQGMDFAVERDFWHIPPIDSVFIHRKFGGVYMLAARLKAKVNVRSLLNPYL